MTLADRLWSKVDKTDGCWNWTGARLPKGYGKIGIAGTSGLLTHRASWLLHFGPIPDGLMVLHHCDNPSCVRPDHLFLGTNTTNMRDCTRKGRHYSHFKGATHCKWGHEYTPENTYTCKRGWRQCIQCQNIRSRAKRAKEKLIAA